MTHGGTWERGNGLSDMGKGKRVVRDADEPMKPRKSKGTKPYKSYMYGHDNEAAFFHCTSHENDKFNCSNKYLKQIILP
jgi:hypothetical protein